MKVVITGSAKGIGRATAILFLQNGHTVYGIDELPADYSYPKYIHYIADVSDKSELPEIDNVDILINNAGIQDGECIDVNLRGLINTTEKYGLQPHIKSICNLASVSAHNGAEFPEYTASKGGVLSYTKWCAKAVAQYGATCNSLSFGGVITGLNDDVINDDKKWQKIMDMTPLKKWATPGECAQWIYFITTVNRSCSGQDIIIDNLETLNHIFVW